MYTIRPVNINSHTPVWYNSQENKEINQSMPLIQLQPVNGRLVINIITLKEPLITQKDRMEGKNNGTSNRQLVKDEHHKTLAVLLLNHFFLQNSDLLKLSSNKALQVVL